MEQLFRWGIVGTGNIARAFAGALNQLPNASLQHVLSRDPTRAEKFARHYGGVRATAEWADFLADPDLDVVYIATPHPSHYRETLDCLAAGKHVLTEKPLALNRRQASAMIAAAQVNGRFLMEAMWMWFIPATIEAREILRNGGIGNPQVLMADFGFTFPFDPQNRFFNPALGGGALLDIGIYPLALALYLFGKPSEIHGQAVLGQTGVDETMTAVLRYADGRVANCTATMRAETTNEAVIAGPDGYLRIHKNFWYSDHLSLTVQGKTRRIQTPFEGNGYNYEIEHVHACLAENRLESPVMRWQDSLDLMEMMDSLRAAWGLAYPGEDLK